MHWHLVGLFIQCASEVFVMYVARCCKQLSNVGVIDIDMDHICISDSLAISKQVGVT